MKTWEPLEEVRFAAKSGFLTKALWQRFFAGKLERSWASRRWNRLLNKSYFLKHPSSICVQVIVPNPGSRFVQSVYPGKLPRPPYVAHVGHDEVLYEGLLELLRLNVIRDFVTEAELKGAETNGFLHGTEQPKLPDVIATTVSDRALAIEIELNQKSRKRYRELFSAYRLRKDVNAILFVISNRAVMTPILAAADEVMFPKREMPIGFMSIEGWRTNPADRAISFGDGATTLKKFTQYL